jgi:mRNA-degrading endonuclease RelE of RelBE toxin-antitoxin system
MYEVVIKKTALRNLRKMPEQIQKKMANLVEDLRNQGPIRSEWPNFSKLGEDRYHCHLS